MHLEIPDSIRVNKPIFRSYINNIKQIMLCYKILTRVISLKCNTPYNSNNFAHCK